MSNDKYKSVDHRVIMNTREKQEFQSQYFSILAREGTQFFMGHYQSWFLQIVHQSSGILPCLSFCGPSLDETLPAELWLTLQIVNT